MTFETKFPCAWAFGVAVSHSLGHLHHMCNYSFLQYKLQKDAANGSISFTQMEVQD